jgi:hypothetical protein
MARKIKTLEEAPVDVVEAVKRGFIHRGFIPRKYRRNSQLQDEPVASQTNSQSSSSDNKTAPAKSKKSKDPGVEIIDTAEGSQEAAKDPEEPEPGETHEKLIDLTEKAQDILFTADTVFPFTLFPDTVTLDREKLTVVERFFFRVAKIITVPVTSMISADTNVGPFFGSVHMNSKYFIDNTHVIKFLWRHDAEQFHRLLQGFIISQEKGLDVSDVEKEDLKVLLHDLGQGVRD